MPEKKEETRGYIPVSLNRLFKRTVEKKKELEGPDGYRWTQSDAMTQAISEWLAKPENKEIIERHNLEEE